MPSEIETERLLAEDGLSSTRRSSAPPAGPGTTRRRGDRAVCDTWGSMIRRSLPLLLTGLLAPLAAAPAQTREPLRCVDPEGRTTLTQSEAHFSSEASVARPVLVHQVDPQADGKPLVPSHPLLYEMLIDKEGRVCAARLLVGSETQESRSWLAAIRQWRYQPATLHQGPVAFFMIESVRPAKEEPPAPPAPQPLARSTAEVVITPQQIKIANHAIPLPASRQQLIAVLGNPTRVNEFPEGTNRILVWDPLGLVVYESQATGKIFEICFYLQSKPDRDFSPRTLSGPLALGGTKIDANSTLDAIGHQILQQGGKHVRRLAFGVWTLNYGSFDISLEEIDSATIQNVSVDLHP